MKQLTINHPMWVVCILISVIFSLRIFEVFGLRSDELFGEQFLTKIIGLVLIIGYVVSAKGNLGSIGIHSKYWLFSSMLGFLVMAVGLFVGYGAEWLYLHEVNEDPRFFMAAQGHTLIPENIAAGGLFFGVTLLSGNVINSFMEEGLFRGVIITHFGYRIGLTKANLLQACLFGIWHIVWPIRDYLDGQTSLNATLGTSIGYIFLSGLIGFAWGYLYLKTNSLWTSWSAHTLNNTVINFFHVTTVSGMPSTLGLRVGIATLVVLALLPIVKKITKAKEIQEVETWSLR
jgi:membrane protease YdiL (CAAX protease family)